MDPPRDLTVPEPGSTTMRQVLGEYLKNTLSTFLRLPLGRFHSTVAGDFYRVRTLVRRLAAHGSAGAVFAAVRRSTVSTLVRCVERELYAESNVDRLDAWLSELSATIAWELFSSSRAIDAPLSLHRPPTRLVSLGTATEVLLGHPERLEFGREGAMVTQKTGATISVDLHARLSPGETRSLESDVSIARPYFAVREGLYVALADNNPLSSVEAHPDKDGNAIDLGTATVERWVAAFREALALTERYLPELAGEIEATMQLLVPVGTSDVRHLSASYAEAVGTAYLTLHPDPMTMVEALIHESSHNKLNAFLRLDPVLRNAHSAGHVSPVRPDPRPLLGLLLAAHAFVPVARLYELMIEAGDPLSARPGFRERYRTIVTGNHEAIASLKQVGKPTMRGKSVLDELARWDDHYANVRQP